MKLGRDDMKQMVFGASDGATTTVGGIVPLWVSGHHNSIIIAASGTAIASALSMAFGEFTADEQSSFRRALVMGGATLIGAIVPVVGFLVYHKDTLPVLISIICTLLLALVVAKARSRLAHESNVRALSLVMANFLVVSAVTAVVGLTAPGTNV